MKIGLIPLLLAAALAACESSTGLAFSQDGFSVRVDTRQLVLRNESPAVIHYVVLEAGTATVTDLQPRAELWPSVAPGAETRIPFEQLNGYSPAATQARVFWATTEGLQPSFLVSLR